MLEFHSRIVGKLSPCPLTGDLIGRVSGVDVVLRRSTELLPDGSEVWNALLAEQPSVKAKTTHSTQVVEGGCVIHTLSRRPAIVSETLATGGPEFSAHLEKCRQLRREKNRPAKPEKKVRLKEHDGDLVDDLVKTAIARRGDLSRGTQEFVLGLAEQNQRCKGLTLPQIEALRSTLQTLKLLGPPLVHPQTVVAAAPTKAVKQKAGKPTKKRA